MNKEQYHALWRQSAYEAVPYTEDFPECLLVLPELIDGGIGQGAAEKILIKFVIKDKKGILTVEDNGVGIKNLSRLLHWAAAKSTDNIHRNGHGTKKALTKFHTDYNTANWNITYRKKNRNLVKIEAPFLGTETKQDDIENDNTTLMPSGTSICIEFDPTILDRYKSAKALNTALRELIQTRYSERHIQKTEFVIDIDYKNSKIIESSKAKQWHSLKYYVQEALKGKEVDQIYHYEQIIEGGKWIFDEYRLQIDGRQDWSYKKSFPVYGKRSTTSSRVHISVDGRTNECIPYYKLYNREVNHNDYNGRIGFVEFIPNTPEEFEKMPIPCTTKVSFYENGSVFKKFKEDFYKYISLNKTSNSPSSPTPSSTKVSPIPPSTQASPTPSSTKVSPIPPSTQASPTPSSILTTKINYKVVNNNTIPTSNITISKDTCDPKTIIINHYKFKIAVLKCSAEPHNTVNELKAMLDEIGEEKFIKNIKAFALAKNAVYN